MKNEKTGLPSRAFKCVLRAALAVLSVPGRLLSLPVRFYRRFISPAKGAGVCRFSPTCSEYALISLREWGVIAGGALTLWRILRCNPFSKGGEDPVPKNPLKSRLYRYLYGQTEEDSASAAADPVIPEERK